MFPTGSTRFPWILSDSRGEEKSRYFHPDLVLRPWYKGRGENTEDVSDSGIESNTRDSGCSLLGALDSLGF